MTSASRPAAVSAARRADARRPCEDVVAAYVGLTKPRVIELLLLTTVPVMFFAARGVPASAWSSRPSSAARSPPGQRQRPQLRLRPRHRRADAPHPPPGAAAAHRLPRAALVFGLVLGVVSTLVLGLWVNWLSAGLALAANVFYVFGYTMLLKRRTTQNIVWGGIAGCFPALIGWTAVTGELAWAPVVLFAGRLLLDAAAHLGAGDALPRGLRGRRRADAAGRRRPREVGRQIVLYSLGDGRDLAAAVAGRRHRRGSTRSPPRCSARSSWSRRTGCGPRARGHRRARVIQPMRLFHSSNIYLSLLFVAVALDPLLTTR